MEPRRHDADDRMLLAVERKRSVQHFRIRIQMVSPELFADDSHSRRTRIIFSGIESPSFERSNSKNRKEVCTHVNTRNLFRRAPAAQCEAAGSSVKHRNLFARLLVVTPGEKVCFF